MSMTIEELTGQVSRFPELENRVAALENLAAMQHFLSAWPEFVGLRQLCERCGLSYSSMRRSERQRELPNRGRRDVEISGRKYWRRSTVLEWLEERT